MAGAIFAQRRRSEFRHVLGEDVARGDAFHEQRADVANHGSDPVAFFQGVAGADGDGFLAEAGIKAADNFILAEEADHSLFELAVQLHVVVEVEMLRAGQRLCRRLSQRLGHAMLPFSSKTSLGRGASACWRCCDKFSSSSARVTLTILRSNSSPKCAASLG